MNPHAYVALTADQKRTLFDKMDNKPFVTRVSVTYLGDRFSMTVWDYEKVPGSSVLVKTALGVP